MRRLCVLALALGLPALASGQPRRIGGEDGFRVGSAFRLAVPSPDGRLFALTDGAGFHVLHAGTGRVLHSRDGGVRLHDLAFDARGRLLTLDRRGWVREYDAERGTCLREILLLDPGAEDLPRSWFLPGGLFVHVGKIRDDGARLYAVATGQPLVWPRNLDIAAAYATSRDGTRVACSARAEKPRRLLPTDSEPAADLRVLDLSTGKSLFHVAPGPETYEALVFRPDGQALFVLLDAQPALVDLVSGEVRILSLEGWPKEGTTAPIWSPDGRKLALCRPVREEASLVCEWEVETGRLVRQAEHSERTVVSSAYTTEGRLLFWNTGGVRLAVRDLDREPPSGPIGHRFPLCDLAFGAEDTLVSVDSSGQICRWDCRTGTLVRRDRLPEEVRVHGKITHGNNWQLAPNGQRAFLKTVDGLATFDLERGRLDPVAECPVAPDFISPDGRWLLEWREKKCHLHDSVRCRGPVPLDEDDLWREGRDRATYPFWSPDGRWLALCLARVDASEGRPRSVRLDIPIVKLPAGRVVSRILVTCGNVTGEPHFTPDGRTLLVECDGYIAAFDPATGLPLRQYRHPDRRDLYPLAVSPDSRFLLVAESRPAEGSRTCLMLIELATGSVRKRLPIPTGVSCRLSPRFSPDGRRLALALSDSTIGIVETDSDVEEPRDPATLWRDLAASDAGVAGAAVQALTRRPDAVRWIRARIGASSDPDEEEEFPALFWLAELEHEDPNRREAARKHLAAFPENLAQVEAALTGTASPEVSRALDEIRVEGFVISPPGPVRLRRARLREVLDRINSPEARTLRDHLR